LPLFPIVALFVDESSVLSDLLGWMGQKNRAPPLQYYFARKISLRDLKNCIQDFGRNVQTKIFINLPIFISYLLFAGLIIWSARFFSFGGWIKYIILAYFSFSLSFFRDLYHQGFCIRPSLNLRPFHAGDIFYAIIRRFDVLEKIKQQTISDLKRELLQT